MAAANNRPIIVKKVKKVAGGHHGGAWKVAYADFVTAMMAFFMLLWLVANPDKQRLKGLAQYFSPSSESSGSMTSVSATTAASAAASAQTKSQGSPAVNAATPGVARGGSADVPDASQRVLASELKVALESSASEGAATKVESSRDGLRITLMDTDRQPMFRVGTAELNPYARALIARVAAKLARSGAPIAVEGHTDGSGGNGDANWRLSGERAMSARSALIAAGIPENRLAETVAMGATVPVYPDQPDRAENRRITIILKGEAPSLPSDSSFQF